MSKRRHTLLVVSLAVLAITAIAGAAVSTAGDSSALGSKLEQGPIPDWFLPIADAYDRSPAITPNFDFSLLYDARPEAHLQSSAGSRRVARHGDRQS